MNNNLCPTRKGDPGIGLPPEDPEPETFPASAAQPIKDEDEENWEIIHNRISRFGFLRSPLLIALALVMAACLTLFTIAQAVSFWTSIQLLPALIRWILVVIMAGLSGFILYSVVRIFLMGKGMSSLGQTDLSKFKLSRNASKDRSIKNSLRDKYVRLYSDHFDRSQKEFGRLSKDECDAIRKHLDRLLDPDDEGFTTTEDWVNHFRDEFVATLDQIADNRISHYAKWVALKTAISPWPFVDVLAVAYNTSEMIRDMAIIYNRRLNAIDVAGLTIRVLFVTLIAGNSQAGIDEIEKQGTHISKILGDKTSEVPVTASEDATSVFGKILGIGNSTLQSVGPLLKKVGEGMANYLLMRHLGRASKELFRPLA